MKRILLSICAISLIIPSSDALAQTINPTAAVTLTLQCAGGTGNRAGIAYNPNQQYYYSVNAGSGSYPIETFSVAGAPLASTSSGYSYRGFWWNPTTNGPEGKVYGAAGITTQNLDASFFPTGSGTLIVAGSGPDSQSCGDYDPINDEVYYYFSGTVYRYDRSTHTLTNSYAVTGIPGNIADLNTNSAVYTGVPGAEIGIFDNVAKALYYIDRTTGAYVGTTTLTGTIPDIASFKLSFENDYLWLYNSVSNQWEGYKAVETCTNTTNSIVENACGLYTSPSGNYTYNTTGIYTDTIPNMAGCDSIITIDLTVTTLDLTVTNNSPTLISNATGATYQWLFCDNGYSVIASATNASFTAGTNGSYAVEVTDNGCKDTSSCFSVAGIGFEEINESIVQLYPNPTNDLVMVNMKTSLGLVNYTVTSLDGKLIQQGIVSKGIIQIDLSKEENGIYIFRFDDGQSISTHKVIKQ